MENYKPQEDWDALLAAEGMYAEPTRDENIVLSEDPYLTKGRESSPNLFELSKAQIASDQEDDEATRAIGDQLYNDPGYDNLTED